MLLFRHISGVGRVPFHQHHDPVPRNRNLIFNFYCARDQVLTVDLTAPEPFNLSRRLEALDKGILDARHVEEPGYSAYGEFHLCPRYNITFLMISIAVVHVASSLVIDDLARLIDHVRDLVGETDFSFKVETDADSVSSTLVPGKTPKGKAD